ncbi:MAG: hypothetical protein ACYC1I_09270 [Acidimicrobiales bacterium]
MSTPIELPELSVIRVATGERLSWSDALRSVWSGVTPPEALELRVIWPVSICDVTDQNER